MLGNPLLCGGIHTKEKVEDKWLGQIISSAGLTASVAKTVATKEGKIKGACLEIAIVVNDWRAQAVGGMETALMLREALGHNKENQREPITTENM